MRLIYVAHPCGSPAEQPANLARCKRWLRWLILTSSLPDQMAFLCPWLHELELQLAHPGELPVWHRAAIMDRCIAVAARCDGLVLVGGRISPGMQREADVAPSVLDLTHLGDEPPEAP